MSDLFDPDTGTAFYRSRDPIKNLKIRVTLERVTSASVVPQAQLEREAGGNVEMQDIAAQQQSNFGGQKDVEEFTFKWQQKVFSKREVQDYSTLAPDGCDTVLKRKYHNETQVLQEVGRPTQRLFSFTENDDYKNLDENDEKFTTSPNEQPNLITKKTSNLRHRNVNKKSNPLIPKTNIVEYEPSPEVQKEHHFPNTSVQTFYIMADLSAKGKEVLSKEDEFVLCTIKMDANSVLSVKPDFNKGRKAYRIEGSGTGRDVFEYTLEHASKQLTIQERSKEEKMYKELINRHSEYLAARVGHDFELPDPDSLRMLVFGEIISAQNFEYDDLFVHYFVDLPEFWSTDGMQQLSGVTQTCSTKTEGRNEIAYFSYPFSFELVFRNDSYLKHKEEMIPKIPQLFLEVQSLDSWQRYRTEGYGYTSLPTIPGMHTESIHCWRPVGRSVVSELRRFFIGGSPELEDPTYTATPSTHDGNRLSKYGFKTVSTGNVTVRMNVILQSKKFLEDKASKRKMGSVLDRLGMSSAQTNILSVIEAFQKAKERMVAAREGVKQEFVETIRTLGSEGETEA